MKTWLKNKIKEYYSDADFDVLTPPSFAKASADVKALADKSEGKSDMGDYSINLAFILAKQRGISPIEAGAEIVKSFLENAEFKKYFDRIAMAGNGFVNFYLSDEFLKNEFIKILEEKDKYGSGQDKQTKINLEFISANPTGPLTVGNARAASYGDTLGNVFKKTGYQVVKEYYINDIGVQVDKLTKSEINTDMQNHGLNPKYKEEGLYSGKYIISSTQETVDFFSGKRLNELSFDEVKKVAVQNHVNSAKKVLEKMGVRHDEWFFEHKLHIEEIDSALDRLKKSGVVEDKDGATWFNFDGDKSAVLIKSDGNKTYLMGDIAYTINKLEKRKFGKAINIWGTDHHGDVPRLLAATKTLGYEGKLEIILHQLVTLKSRDEKLKISKRAGNIVLLEDLVGDVGKDAARFFFLAKDLNTHMEFDVDLAKEQSNKNPVFYIQYAYARLNQVFSKGKVEDRNLKAEKKYLDLLVEPEEIRLIRKMVKLPELIEDISINYQVHHLAQYSYELASAFHNFYEKHRIIQEDKKIEKARILLCLSVAGILGVCLGLMGLSAPKKM